MRLTIRAVVAVFVLLMFSVPSFAATAYHVRNGGDDSKSGTSDATAWATIAKVNSSSFSAGDSILFKRGSTWEECLEPPSSGISGSPITFGSYSTGNLPIITAERNLPGWTTSGNWTPIGSNRYTKSLSDDPCRLFLNGTEYGVAASQSEVDATWRWYYASGTLTVYATSTPSSFYSKMRVAYAGTGSAMDVNGRNYLTFQNLAFQGGECCIWMGSCDYIVFDGCNIAKNATQGIHICGNEGGSDYGEIKNCTVSREDHIVEYCQAPATGGEDNIKLADNANHWLIHDNLIEDVGHSAVNIYWASGAGTCSYNEVYRNEITMHGEYGRAIDCQGEQSGKCSYNRFYRNWIHDMATVSQITGDHNTVEYNVIENSGVWVSWHPRAKSYAAIGLEEYFYDDYNSINNNTIKHSLGPGIQVRGDAGHPTVINNILYDCGYDGDAGGDDTLYVGLAIWSDVANGTFRNNDIYNANTTYTVTYHEDSWGSCTPITVSAFNALNGNSSNTISSNIGSDPLLDGSGEDWYKLTSNSPCIDAGYTWWTGSKVDYDGTSVPVGSHPDIGAYEYHAAAAPAKGIREQ